ncbi:MAG: hypothetical protein JWN43_2205 [Gammaproteobacteria bacterium]|nr:hypothetical protein [Gammaproteobacteria bacterium]
MDRRRDLACAMIVVLFSCPPTLRADAQAAYSSADPPCTPPRGGASDVVRRRPGAPSETPPVTPECESDRLPRVSGEEMPPPVAVPNRWRLADELGYRVDWLDSYQGNNPLKGDRPVRGADEFLSVSAVSGTLIEERRVASTALGVPDGQGQRTATQGELFFNQSLALDALLYRGDTVFQPPDWQSRFTTVLSKSGVRAGGTTDANTAAIQALWFEKHLRDVSAHDDFDSARVGIQPLTSDFRGFLLSDQPLAARLFGTRDNNVLQYNVALFRSLRKNAVSLNAVGAGLPRNDVLLANLYWQDFPRSGITSAFVAAYDRNREPGMQELTNSTGTANAPAVRTQHDYDVAYLGYGVDGHYGRLNATAMTYGLLGHERQGTFTAAPQRVQAWFAAAELSVDSDSRRWRLSLLHASGDANPHDRRATGFDGLSANPVFAGTDSSFFVHQQLALAGGAFNLKARNALLPTLNPADGGGQDNYSNPGLDLVGGGVDLDLAPKWRLSFDANQLWFDRSAALADLMLRPIPRNFGTEFAMNAFWRPFENQNVVLRMSNAMLRRGPAYRALYDGGNPYSAFVFLTVSY